MGKFKDITGSKFGRLFVVKRAENIGRDIAWQVRCDCGKEMVLPGINFKYGNTSSCGCLRREATISRFTKHGCAGNREAVGRTREYRIWLQMKDRCRNKKSRAWPHYGGRGIRVCGRWSKSFSDFLADMGLAPSPQHSIDRFPNNDGNYQPTNCRWATSSEQAFNRRSPCPTVFKGVSKPLTHWAREHGLSCNVVRCRLRMGWTLEKSLKTSKRSYGPRTATPSLLPPDAEHSIG